METVKFSMYRLFLLMRRQLTINSKNLLISFSACTGILLIINFLKIYFGGKADADLLISLTFVMMYIGGYIFTSIGFNELHSPHKAYQYLTLPATTLEKLASVWLLTTIVYVFASLVLLGTLVILCNLFALFVGSSTVSYIELMRYPIHNIVWTFLVTQSVFLLGSCYFRKNNFLKTILALFIVGFALGVYATINGYIFFGTEFQNFDGNQMNGVMTEFMEKTFPGIMKFLFNYLLAPFFYVVSYFVLKERQV